MLGSIFVLQRGGVVYVQNSDCKRQEINMNSSNTSGISN